MLVGKHPFPLVGTTISSNGNSIMGTAVTSSRNDKKGRPRIPNEIRGLPFVIIK